MNLETYRHQVGGHSKLVKSHDATKLYKPLVENELSFYKKLASLDETMLESRTWQILKKFIPGYHGTMEFHLQAAPIATTNADMEAPDNMICNSPFSVSAEHVDSASADFDEMRLSGGLDTLSYEGCDDVSVAAESVMDSALSHDSIRVQPEVVTVAYAGKNEPETSTSTGTLQIQKYIVLDDLAHKFKKPCVLDIKMGKRQRKIGASIDKEQRQLEKSMTTTSSSLGFRLCGYQSYDKKHDKFCYRDKYWGRKIGKEEALRAIRGWFWNGLQLHVELIVSLVKKLDIVYQCVSELHHYRFWSSSLLWLYDGGSKNREARLRSLDIRMIDFANLNFLPDSPSPDTEYLDALSNLSNILMLLAIAVKRKGILRDFRRDLCTEKCDLGKRWHSSPSVLVKEFNRLKKNYNASTGNNVAAGKSGIEFFPIPNYRTRSNLYHKVAKALKLRLKVRPPFQRAKQSNVSLQDALDTPPQGGGVNAGSSVISRTCKNDLTETALQSDTPGENEVYYSCK